MGRIKAWVRSIFGFSRGETNAFLILLPLMALIIFSAPAYRYWLARQPQDFTKDQKSLDSLIATWEFEKPTKGSPPAKKQLADFDPNQTTQQELVQLGFPPFLALRIINYRAKGGKFSVKSDLKKIYGMDSGFYQALYPYIDLPTQKTAQKKEGERTTHVPFAKKEAVQFDLNLADTAALISVYGIGTKLAMRIVQYRERLGGFIAMGQLREVYGLDSAVVAELGKKTFVVENFQPRQININQASEKELIRLPYIKFAVAKAIVAYRFQHGAYSTLEELKKIALVDEALFEKIKIYLTLK